MYVVNPLSSRWQQLDHGRVRAVAVAAPERGVRRLLEEGHDLPVVVFDVHRVERRGDRAHEEVEVAVVALVVLDHCSAHPVLVALVRRLVGLAVAQA